MTTWILLAFLLLLVQAFLPAVFDLPRIGLTGLAGPRDDQSGISVTCARARRALNNLLETMPIFVGLAVLSVALPETEVDGAQALLGAQIYVVARAIYLPIYISGVPWLRTLVWLVALAGLGAMALAVV